MKIQRKLLTKEQKEKICLNNKSCYLCPIAIHRDDDYVCYDDIERLSDEISCFWSEEIEVDI